MLYHKGNRHHFDKTPDPEYQYKLGFGSTLQSDPLLKLQVLPALLKNMVERHVISARKIDNVITSRHFFTSLPVAFRF